ncbi:GHKL domain-containing protein [Clostridium sp. JN-9]|uniref:sensor histidine kinase n=1 Tax=Clostridium sp. JN-9 TaxID=2507159 RepID=UPI000FFDF9BA|nr:GHKL domain-containing protein [Clostridium sp. JN-9]QAT39625.1 GHKL domain-containing protein [Clostridium sp. JN-9]
MTLEKFITNFLSYMIIPSFLTSILCCISIYILYKKIIDIKEIKEYFLFSFMIGMILNIGSYTLILPMLVTIMIIQLLNNKDTNKIKIQMTIYAVYLANSVYTFIYAFSGRQLYNIPLENILIQFLLMLIILTIVCIIISFISSIKKIKREPSVSSIRLKMILVTSIPFSMIMYVLFKVSQLVNNEQSEFIYGNFFPQALPLIFIMLISTIIYNYDRSVEIKLKLKREIEEKSEIEEYSHIVEDMYSQTRRFKHDYMNMIAPLKEYIDTSDIVGLQRFFYENVINMDKDIKWSSSNIDKLKYINVSGLKAILSSKLIKALSMNIDIQVDIVENIEAVSMNIMDLCRIIGILMDNAMEAAAECEKPKINLCIVSRKNYIIIAIQNNYFGKNPVIHKIYREGFSTKGQGRGLGLYTVKNIIDTKYDNVLINTSVEDNMFIQELWIK